MSWRVFVFTLKAFGICSCVVWAASLKCTQFWAQGVRGSVGGHGSNSSLDPAQLPIPEHSSLGRGCSNFFPHELDFANQSFISFLQGFVNFMASFTEILEDLVRFTSQFLNARFQLLTSSFSKIPIWSPLQLHRLPFSPRSVSLFLPGFPGFEFGFYSASGSFWSNSGAQEPGPPSALVPSLPFSWGGFPY